MDSKILVNGGDYNINNSKCIVAKEYFTHTQYTNICNGSVTKLNNSPMDYAAIFIMFALLTSIFGMLVFAGISTFKKN